MKTAVSFLSFLCFAYKAQAWHHWDGELITDPEEQLVNHQLIAFVHPTDESSQALESEWLSLQQTSTAPKDTIISIDCSTRPKDCSKLKVRSFPTIRLYFDQGRKFHRYRGPHRASAIQKFFQRCHRATEGVLTVDSRNMTSFISSDDIVFIAHVGQHDSRMMDMFTTEAVRHRCSYSFAVASEGAGKSGNKQQTSSVTCYNNLDDMHHTTTEWTNRESSATFIKTCSTPLIPEMTRGNELWFYETRKSLVHYFVHNDKERDAYVAEMRPLAKKYQEYLHFTTTDVNEYPDAVEMMGLKRGSSKGLSVQNPNNGHVYPYTRSQPLSASVIELFLGDIIQGKVKPFRGGDGEGGEGRGHEEL